MKKMYLGLVILVVFGLCFGTGVFMIPADADEDPWVGNITINADGSVSPSDAPIDIDGDTYTMTDDVKGSIYVYCSDIVIDGDGYVLDGAGAFVGVYLTRYREDASSPWIYCENVEVKNMEIENFTYGIYTYFGGYHTISYNDIHDCKYAMNIYYSGYNTIADNTVTDNTNYGIYIYFSSYNTISDNTITDNAYGIYVNGYRYYASPGADSNTISDNTVKDNTNYGILLYYSSSNVLTDNAISGSDYNFGVRGSTLLHYTQTIDSTNTVEGAPIYYLVGKSYATIPSDAGYVGVVDSDHITVKGPTLSNNYQGVLMAYSTYSTIENVNAMYDYYGIYVYYSDHITIKDSTVMDNYDGIYLWYSNYIEIKYNTITDNEQNGIYLRMGEYNTIEDNLIANCNTGITIVSSKYVEIFDNRINNCARYGMYLTGGRYLTLDGNILVGNYRHIYLVS
ncbi:MAG: NosD domain-containing protein [Candidatus Thermoplasmatota archaeon]|nr:NosD domain-containing protein [Candidatus Thermoplasmatota archaeon]